METKDTVKINNTLLWIAGGVGVAGAGFGAWYFLIRKRKSKDGKTMPASVAKSSGSASKSSTGSSTPAAKSKPAYELDVRPFHPAYKSDVLKATGNKIRVLTESAAKKVADTIEDAWGFFNDDEEAVYNAFRQLKDKVQISQVAAAYQKYHKKDLLSRLKSKLSTKELATVTDIVDDLPNYRTA